ncbi:MAG: tetraacyldisaccharide 4'-kinase [Xanthomonadales bacterium]|nr:tetraacyldisaccharide 4'-kinase [Gammaproteobacteria bacterium]MBT8049738.1 tetraacyldisaccharide 4'-kinase [Gammaproteobacteria bacterium]MBT8055756.1 tetraacyldisaccharide 4'-kinase [Gammaproteobacteria bacterium]NNJ79331.1 tetraacyldisaccharide 4'-kinase [Xanthomonadales bacterium]NNL04834.1 tetraacyldisaccharide 4'-kinase [Xanthomonadales bacterium]
MQADTEQKLNRYWYGGEAPPSWLRALTPLYRLGNRIDRRIKSAQRPADLAQARIIVVGNLTVGGSGKTPLVIRLCELLRAAGLKPGVVSRGYRRRGKELLSVTLDSKPGAVGDEPLLISRRTGAPVVVAEDRCEAARRLLEEGVDVVVSDDGLQHYRLPRTVEICVVDGARGFGNGLLLPAGPLREPLERLESVDYVVVNGEGATMPKDLQTVPMTLTTGWLRALDDTQSWRLAQFAGCRVNAVAGIGNPGRFFELLRHARITVNEYPFADHHRFTRADFDSLPPGLPIVMTEKDAVKASVLDLDNAWSLEVDAALPAGFEADLLKRIAGRSP